MSQAGPVKESLYDHPLGNFLLLFFHCGITVPILPSSLWSLTRFPIREGPPKGIELKRVD